ncbi:hypothetical protein B0T26DRAFT_676018 [Lasiosphaeria miniovina]|uniref:F-box domain-containing protein n=1 Tax=Lasiosphaeria miniovina TaxID=1954250 RepID=A0AA40E019_9PEZI|nr:uncharacterized protein B0T26DRAFT_676018 [Lasiosphaeria miniovina]KAK0717753.1 hypothetical protein B0T26DRAFT_676018 [Lasiosphaeria miniovina]
MTHFPTNKSRSWPPREAPPVHSSNASTLTTISETPTVENENTEEKYAGYGQHLDAPNPNASKRLRLRHTTTQGRNTQNSQDQHRPNSQQPTFLALPDLLLLLINGHLPAPSQTALALVNKRTLSVLVNKRTLSVLGGNLVPPMGPESRHAFLKLLDRDLTVLVYCTVCKLIHSPFHDPDKPYAAWQVDDSVRDGWPTSQYTMLPFNMVHSITRNHRAGRNYTELLSIADPGLGARGYPEARLRRGAFWSKTRFAREASGSGSGGNVLQMVQKILPVSPGAGDKKSLRNLYELNWYVRWSSRICDHRRWNTEYPFLLFNNTEAVSALKHSSVYSRYVRGKDGWRKYAAFTLEPDTFHAATDALPAGVLNKSTIDPRLYCALAHYHDGRLPCSCPANMQAGVVRSCDRCDTDFCFTVVTTATAPGDPNNKKEESFWVFTMWKNYGEGATRNDPVWKAHVSNYLWREPRPSTFARSSAVLWPYTQFGKACPQSDEYGTLVYKPKPPELAVQKARADKDQETKKGT